MPNWTTDELNRLKQRNPDIQIVGAGLPMGKKCKGGEIKEGIVSSPVCSELERHARPRRVGKKKAEGEDRRRFLCRITSVRTRLIDEDNLCGKPICDLARYCGALPSDAPEFCKIETRQRKAEKDEYPHTVIEIFVVD